MACLLKFQITVITKKKEVTTDKRATKLIIYNI